MTIPLLAIGIRVCWVIVEFPYLRRFHVQPAKDWDKRSALFWDLANVLEVVGIAFGLSGRGAMPTSPRLIGAFGLGMLLMGILIRWAAIKTLGQFFTTTVVIKNEHQLIRTGLYRYVRHPAYTGTLLAHLGLGLSFSNWVALAFSSIPFLAVALYRMHVEEKALHETFGTQYYDYTKSAKRLLPGIY